MSPRLRLIALVWVVCAVLLRIYGSSGGDASITSGLLFLVWTAPFGPIWQFNLYDYALMWLPIHVVQVVGDVLVILVAFFFWFIAIPKLHKVLTKRKSR